MDEHNFSILQKIKGIGKKRYQAIIQTMTDQHISIENLFSMDADTIKNSLKLPSNIAQEIVAYAKNNPMPSTATEIQSVKSSVVSNKESKEWPSLLIGDETYPTCLENILKSRSPKKLWFWGNLDLLCQPAIGFCGSRNVSDKGIAVTRDVVEQITALDWVTVSGHARGVDTAAHLRALEMGGRTIIVAAEGLSAFKMKSDLKRFAKSENVLVISEFEPEARWTMYRAMQRNNTIIGLSAAMVLVESRMEGGTFEAGKSSLKHGVPLFVVHYASGETYNAGNQYFIEQGATPLARSASTGRANIEPIKAMLERQSDISNQEISKQKNLL